jgi:hypothetical protein
MATGQVSPKRGKVIDIPANAPTIGTAADAVTGGAVSVPFTAGSTATGGPVFSYRAVSNPGSIVGTGTSSPITVSGLTNDTAYTFTVAAVNPTGYSAFSAASNSATPTVPPANFTSLQTVTAAGGESVLTFSSIPGTYKHLQIRGISKSLSPYGVSGAITRFNSDSGSNYSYHTLGTQGSSIFNSGTASTTSFQTDAFSVGTDGATYANMYGYIIYDFIDYASTTKYKTVRAEMGCETNTGAFAGYYYNMSGNWRSTSAITTITLSESSGLLYAAGSTFALYGIS